MTASIGEYDANTGATIDASLITGIGHYPQEIAVDGNTLLVATISTQMPAYDATTGASINSAFITGLQGATGVATWNGNIFVTNINTGHNGYIGEYSSSGTPINASLITGLTQPTNLAVSGGYVFIVSAMGLINVGLSEYTTAGAWLRKT